MSKDVTKWLEGLELGQYADSFEKGAIDWDLLPSLDHEILKELGVKPPGHRLRLLNAIQVRGHGKAPDDSPPPSDSLHAEGDLPALTDDDLGPHASLAAWERNPGERKPVTLLFADIIGSTALTEKRDAEETHELLYGATQRMCEAVENNRGTVCRFMGDGVMAMFGAPMASEQHAVDACEAALEMQEAICDYATNSDASGLQIRVGLHSGEVVVLTVGEGDKLEFDASGPTVPIAARMEQSAQPGEVYLTAATQSLAAQSIETERLNPVSVKGISNPVPVFALRRIRSAHETIPYAARTPFVGRRAELTQFRGMLDTCNEEGHGGTVYVRGEPGIGKTRLLDEFAIIAAEKGVSIHRGLVLRFGVGKGQDAIRSLVRSLLGIAPGGDKNERALAAETALNDGLLDPDHAVFLNDLLDLPRAIEQKALYDAMDNATRNEGKQAVVAALVTAESENQPILAIVEDVHWADAPTLAHLSKLTVAVADCPALLVMTSRIEGDQLDQNWRSTTRGSPFVSVDLGPLRKQDSIALIGKFIDTSDAVAVRCLERAAGNPLFLEQLLRNAQEGTGESLPDSIQSLVLARMDRLEPGAKRALQAASVIGYRFHPDALSHLLEVNGYSCSELVEHNLVRSEGEYYLFAHALIQESVYGSLLKRQRRGLHMKAAEWFEKKDLTLFAQHLDYAASEQAPEAYLRAACEQAGQYHYERALALAKRGLEVAPQSNSFSLRDLSGVLLRNLGAVSESVEIYRSALKMPLDDTDRCRAYIGIAETLRITEQHDEMLAALRQADAIAEKLGLSKELAKIHHLRGGICFMRCEFDACLREHTASLGHARDANSPDLEAQALSGLGDAEYARAHMISAHGYYYKCVELSREHGFGRIVAANLGMLGKTHCYLHDFQSMERDVRAAIDLAKKSRSQRAQMVVLEGGVFLAHAGNILEGKAWIEQRLSIARRLHARNFEISALAHLGNIAVNEGLCSEAVKLAQEAIEILRTSESSKRFCGPLAFGTLALATDDPDCRRSALAEGEELLNGDCLGANYLWFYRDAMEVSLQARAWDDVERYAAALEDYTGMEPLPWSDFYIKRARTLAAFGRGNCDDATTEDLLQLRDEADRVGLKAAIPALEEALSEPV